MNEEKKENFFQPLIEFIFLLLNRNFSGQIISLANQILNILTSAKENVLKATLEKLPEELRNVVEGVIEIEKIGSKGENDKC